MRSDIHPTYFEKATVTCSCGHTFTVGSTKESVTTEICSTCHPFYTGKAQRLDSGRAEKFRAKMEKSAKIKETSVSKKEKEAKRRAAKEAKQAEK